MSIITLAMPEEQDRDHKYCIKRCNKSSDNGNGNKVAATIVTASAFSRQNQSCMARSQLSRRLDQTGLLKQITNPIPNCN